MVSPSMRVDADNARTRTRTRWNTSLCICRIILILMMSLASVHLVLRLREPNDNDYQPPVSSQQHQLQQQQQDQPHYQHQQQQQWNPELNPLAIPPGKAQNLPSVRVTDPLLDKKRRGYGGAGDAVHLGGFSKNDLDPGGLSPHLFKHMIQDYGIKSFLDIGCGRGFSTSWFHFHGIKQVMCAEGSHDAVQRSVLPDPSNQVVEHDFSRGPWWPEKTYDAAWSVEFLEHVNLQYHYNYVSAFRKAALLFVTSSSGAGWHHVEVHKDEWWIRKYESYGFRYSPELTEQARNWAKEGKKYYKGPNGQWLDGFYVRVSLKVFVNPSVAALPKHAHLFPEFGCFGGKNETTGEMIHQECGSTGKQDMNTPLDKSMYPIKLTPEMDSAWIDWLKDKVK